MNNALSNLRWVTRSQNGMNKNVRDFHIDRSQINIMKIFKRIVRSFILVLLKKLEAKEVRIAKEREWFGEFATVLVYVL